MNEHGNIILRSLFIYIRSMLMANTSPMIRTLAWMALVVLAFACASGPRYGAARKQKKGCDCPHWNAVEKPGTEEHASVPSHVAGN